MPPVPLVPGVVLGEDEPLDPELGLVPSGEVLGLTPDEPGTVEGEGAVVLPGVPE